MKKIKLFIVTLLSLVLLPSIVNAASGKITVSSTSTIVVGNKVTVTSNKTVYCYLYFDIDYKLSELCKNGDKLGSCLIENSEEIDSLGDTAYAEMYRYTGTNEIVDDNYICFGTTDKEECLNNSDKYMYRIIGVTSEDNTTLGLEKNQVKLIKDTSIETHEWHNNRTVDIKWEENTMYTYLQNDVLNNKTYYTSGWTQKISSVKWNSGNVFSVNDTSEEMFESESSMVTANTSKIGLIYVSDYMYAYNSGGTQNCNLSPYCISWITNSDIFWSMTYFGRLNFDEEEFYGAWAISNNGQLGTNYLYNQHAIRPVFYLNEDERYVSGEGTVFDPIIINNPPVGDVLINNPSLGLNTINNYGGLYRYIGETANNYVLLKNESDEILFRIIGIVSEDDELLNLKRGQLKLIKASSIGLNKWHSDYSSDVNWGKNSLFTYLQSQEVLTNNSIIPERWKDKISSVKWNIGNVQDISSGTSVFESESLIKSPDLSKIGLINLSDFYYAYNSGGTQNCNVSPYCVSWLSKNFSGNMWTISKDNYNTTDSRNLVWYVASNGYISSYWYLLTDELNIFPVFYLDKNVYMNDTNDLGTINKPFVLEFFD